MQDNFFAENERPEGFFEKLEVKSTSTKVGFIYLLLLFIPIVIRYLFSFTVSSLKLNYSEIVSDPIFQNIWQILVSTIMMIVPAIILIRLSKKNISEMISFKRPKKGTFLPFIFIGMGVCAFANIAANTIVILLENFGIYYSSPSMDRPEGIFGASLIILSSAVTPALVEEFLMRGAVLGAFKRCGENIAVIISAVLFSLMHANMVQFPFAFIVGLILAVAVLKSGSIWTGIAIHFMNNFMSVVLTDLLPFGEQEILRGLATTVYFAISFALFFVGIFMLNRKDKDALRLSEGELNASFKEKLGWIIFTPAILIGIVLSVLMAI